MRGENLIFSKSLFLNELCCYFQFSNLLGTVYHSGNLIFTPDGSKVISPVGNRLSVFDLKNNKSETLPIASNLCIKCVAQSPNGATLVAVNSDGEALLCSLVSKSILHRFSFHAPVHDVKFSPDGRQFAVTKDSLIQVFHAPGPYTNEVNPFALYRTFYGAYDATTCIDWTTDSRVFAAGGNDMNTRVHAARHFSNLVVYGLGGHSDAMVGCFFEENSLDLHTVSRNGQVIVWKCDTELTGLIPCKPAREELDTAEENTSTGVTDAAANEDAQTRKAREEAKTETKQVLYRRYAKHSYKDLRGGGYVPLTCAAYHKKTHILVSCFSNGSFFIHEMPDFNLIHSLSVSDQKIASVDINVMGDWLAFGCSGLGQLLVWEWQSESYILKQEGHFNNMNSLAYSPDGASIVTGGQDGKVKVWSTSSGFCTVTFTEHTSGVTCVTFNQNGQVALSASLDGTVRAYDLYRYRNFRTFTSPHAVKFSSLAIDHSGEIVCAGGHDTFEIFVWSMQNGRLLDILTGHQGPISSLCFSKARAMLASASWDKTMRLWDIFESKGGREAIDLTSDAMAIAFRHDGQEIAVVTIDCQISFWDAVYSTALGSIEGRRDLGGGRRETDKVTAKKSREGRTFVTLCYSPDGECIIAAGQSKNVCIYSVREKVLIKKFEITRNMSFDGAREFLDARKMTEFGNINLIEEEDDGGFTSIALPGVQKGDMAARRLRPDIRVSCVQFSPTGRAWAATTTEGLLVFSTDANLVFDPFELGVEVTQGSVRKTLQRKEYSLALILAFRLNEQSLIRQVIECTPYNSVEHIARALPDDYVERTLRHVAVAMEASPHVQLYALWTHALLYTHGERLKSRASALMPLLATLQKSLTHRYTDLNKICDSNKYTIQYLLAQAEACKRRRTGNDSEASGSPDDDDADDVDGIGSS
ncbi:PREDICTED: periodic tryptophan protein 2 homolog [Priapulus caudatus]|uniref:Periodic tryptophan protein 2 homolog n=1 Tax=Priapulus caudatus TaxID=37621 RepID=A0ABM1F2T0_PRICU|nr:PREDICTED: periodic tryptophan protein 2 homolog [Priapulus caudatus]